MTIADLEAQLMQARALGFDGSYEIRVRDEHGNSRKLKREVVIQGAHPRSFLLLLPEEE